MVKLCRSVAGSGHRCDVATAWSPGRGGSAVHCHRQRQGERLGEAGGDVTPMPPHWISKEGQVLQCGNLGQARRRALPGEVTWCAPFVGGQVFSGMRYPDDVDFIDIPLGQLRHQALRDLVEVLAGILVVRDEAGVVLVSGFDVPSDYEIIVVEACTDAVDVHLDLVGHSVGPSRSGLLGGVTGRRW